jgi:hypothetical protein
VRDWLANARVSSLAIPLQYLRELRGSAGEALWELCMAAVRGGWIMSKVSFPIFIGLSLILGGCGFGEPSESDIEQAIHQYGVKVFHNNNLYKITKLSCKTADGNPPGYKCTYTLHNGMDSKAENVFVKQNDTWVMDPDRL